MLYNCKQDLQHYPQAGVSYMLHANRAAYLDNCFPEEF